MGWVVNATPRPLYPRERPGTHCIGCWVGPRAGMDGCGKSCPTPGYDPRTVQSVATLYRLDIFFFKVSRSALGPSSPCISGVPGSFPCRELNLSPPSSAEVRNEWNYTYNPPSSLHGVDSDFTFVPLRTSRRADQT